MHERWCNNHQLICGAKVFAQMSNCLRPSRRLLNQSNFFCWKEQSLNFKFCTGHIFPERIWEEEKAENQTPLKKFLQRFFNLKILYFSIISSYIYQTWTKNTPKCSASKTLSIWTLVIFFRSVLDCSIKKVLNMKFL